ncbi:hypothetical protein [Streptomyces cyaneofuscatus]|uniref:hypothetical protein n=1 Tax=Streptomyces cyaneofuscatus TaxID=66883 RepID=UPI0037FC41C0
MHSRIPMRRLAASGIVGVAALAPAVSAMNATGHPSTTQAVVQAEPKPAAQLTVKSYATYLKQQKTPSEIKNVNAAIRIHQGKVARSGHTGVATASTVWKALPRVKSFGKGVDKVQEVTADTRTWKAKLANR